MNLTVTCDIHSYTIYSQIHFLKRTWTEKQKTFKMIVVFLQKSCLSSEGYVFLSFLSPFCLLLLPSYTKKKAFIKLVHHKKWIFSQGSWILKNTGCCFETHTNLAAQHGIREFCLSMVHIHGSILFLCTGLPGVMVQGHQWAQWAMFHSPVRCYCGTSALRGHQQSQPHGKHSSK